MEGADDEPAPASNVARVKFPEVLVAVPFPIARLPAARREIPLSMVLVALYHGATCVAVIAPVKTDHGGAYPTSVPTVRVVAVRENTLAVVDQTGNPPAIVSISLVVPGARTVAVATALP
jgi:hypothetical protein